MRKKHETGLISKIKRSLSLIKEKPKKIPQKFPQFYSFYYGQKSTAQIEFHLKTLAKEDKTKLENTTVLYYIDKDCSSDLLRKSIYSLKKFVKEAHVVFILNQVTNIEISSIIKNYFPKALTIKSEGGHPVDSLVNIVKSEESIQEKIIFVNENALFNSFTTKLAQKELDSSKFYYFNLIQTKGLYKNYYSTNKKVTLYENINYFRSYYPLIFKSKIDSLIDDTMFSSSQIALPPIFTVSEFDKQKKKRNIFYTYFKERLNYIPLTKAYKSPLKYRFEFHEGVTFIVHSISDDQVLQTCLHSIRRNCNVSHKIYLIDSHHTIINKNLPAYKEVNFVEHYNSESTLPCVLNKTIQESKNDVIFIITSNIQLTEKNTIKTLGSFVIQNDVGAVSPKIITKGKNIKFIGYEFKRQKNDLIIKLKHHTANQDPQTYNLIQNVASLSKDFLVICKDKFDHETLFDEKYNNEYFDIDFCLSLKIRKLNRFIIPFISAREIKKIHSTVNQSDKDMFTQKWKEHLPNVIEL